MTLARRLKRHPVRGQLTEKEAEVLALTHDLLAEFGTGSPTDEIEQRAIEHAYGEPLAGTLGILASYGHLQRGADLGFFRMTEKGRRQVAAERKKRAGIRPGG